MSPATPARPRPAARALALLPLLAAALGAAPARAQTMLDQELRLVEVHSLLVALPALQPPGALEPWQASLGLEVITIPVIDGTTGGKVQLTASDHTRAFPRPRAALGLPVGGGLTGFAGAAWIPPVEVNGVSSHLGALEGGLAWTRGALSAGVRGQLVRARSRSPVTDPATRDTLLTTVLGAQLAAGWAVDAGPARLTPWASAGLTRVDGRFRVTSDGAVLERDATRPTLGLGLRAAWRDLEAAAEWVDHLDRLRHVVFRVAWTPRLGGPGR